MILDLVGEKMLSNQLLTGQEVGGALVPDDAGNILQVAVNRLLKGVRPKQVQGIFATQNAITASPLGSPTAASPEVKPTITWEEWRTMQTTAGISKKWQKKNSVAHSQMELPI
jgi:hypothetical protein